MRENATLNHIANWDVQCWHMEDEGPAPGYGCKIPRATSPPREGPREGDRLSVRHACFSVGVQELCGVARGEGAEAARIPGKQRVNRQGRR